MIVVIFPFLPWVPDMNSLELHGPKVQLCKMPEEKTNL